ncbi:hypothetical protein [uncultured Selenomonas sp.]|uniref:hypothetical protein n=1 Tax=uncultured Selenomonas sp. TaxID=159275 RepID=UPI0026096380|nr:hypothetical protein [uncultured Selenomonas sp.]
MMNRFCRILRQAFALLVLTLIFAGGSDDGAVKAGLCFAAAHDIAGLEDRAVDIDPSNGSVSVTLSESEMDLLSSVRCNLLYLDENVVIHLGSDVNIDADWDTGVFRDNFGGTWPMLDGHPVYIEITEEGDDYNLYSIPIKLNGEECILQVSYSYDTQKYSILGVRRDSEENGMSDQDLIPLKAGDMVTTIHFAKPVSDDAELAAVEAETFRIGSHPVVEDEELGDGTYGYMFEFLAPTGESALSEIAVFNIEGGNITTLAE